MVARDGCARSTMHIRVKAANVPKEKCQQLMGEGPRPFSIAVDSRNGRLWNRRKEGFSTEPTWRCRQCSFGNNAYARIGRAGLGLAGPGKSPWISSRQ
jgi:hypothetical protein